MKAFITLLFTLIIGNFTTQAFATPNDELGYATSELRLLLKNSHFSPEAAGQIQDAISHIERQMGFVYECGIKKPVDHFSDTQYDSNTATLNAVKKCETSGYAVCRVENQNSNNSLNTVFVEGSSPR